MQWQINLYTAPLFVASAMGIILVLITWRHRRTQGVAPFIGLIVLAGEWTLTYAFEIMSIDPQQKLFWAKLEYIGISFIAPAWLIFAYEVTGRRLLQSRRSMALLSLIPAITLLLMWTNDWHFLMYRDPTPVTINGFTSLPKTYGPWFWVFVVYAYIVLLVGTLRFGRRLSWRCASHRSQSIALLISAALPWLGNLISLLHLYPMRYDLTPLGFSLAAPILAWAFLRFRMFGIIPVAQAAIFQSMPDAVIVLDQEDCLVDFNQAAEKIANLPYATSIGLKATQVFPLLAEALERSPEASAEPLEITWEQSETQRIFELRLSPLFESGQETVSAKPMQPVGRLAILHDITSRRKAEEENRQLREFNEQIIQAMGEGIVVQDTDGNFIFANPAAEAVAGYSHEELIGKHWTIVVPPDQQPIVEAADMRRKDGKSDRYEIEILRKDQTRVAILISGKPIFDNVSGQFKGTLAVFTDISEHKKAEAALRESEAKYRLLTETAKELIIVHSLSGEITYINQATCNSLGYPEDEIIGRNIIEFFDPEHRRAIIEQTQRRLAGEMDLYLYESQIISKAGRRISVEISSAPLIQQGKAHSILLVGRDITERKQAEAHVQQRLSELEALNKISTALRAAINLDTMLPVLLDETLTILNADVGSIFLYDAGSDSLHPVVSRGWFFAEGETFRPGEGVIGNAFASGDVIHSQEFMREIRVRHTSSLRAPAGWDGTFVPIRTAQEVVGVFFLAVPLPRELTTDEVRLLTTLSEIAGNAIHRMRLHEQTERSLQRMAALHTIDLAITSSLDLRLSLEVLLNQATNQLEVDAVAVLRLAPHSRMMDLAASMGFHTKTAASQRLRLEEWYYGEAPVNYGVISIPNTEMIGPRFARATLLAAEGFRAYHAMPLIAKGQIKGMLEVFHRMPFQPNPEWLGFLESLAGLAAISIDNAELFESLQRSNTELIIAYDATIEGWSRALDLRDKETEGHTQRVTEMTVKLAQTWGVSDEELVHIRRGALLHDIGKMGVPDHILLKPDNLTSEEWQIMFRHPQLAYDMLSPINYLRPALDIPYCHHEKWDGTGYPRGLKGEQIPLAARLFAVVDVWDALLYDRPYRSGWPEERVRAHIRSLSGTHLDPRVVELFLRVIGEAN